MTHGAVTRRVRSDRGSGSVLAIAVAAAIAALAALALPLYMSLAIRQSVAAAADAAALAAADTASGLLAGFPCEAAAAVATANGSSLGRCELDGLVVTVTVHRVLLGIPVTAAATAGPPRGTAD